MPDSTIQGFKAVKWGQLRNSAAKDIELEQQRLETITPKDPTDTAQWKTYYQERVARLENESVNIAARLFWTNRSEKAGMIKRYFDVLDMLIKGVNKEEDFHVLESMMNSMVKSEAKRLRREHPEFF
jgi:hypothetical protein